MIGLCTDSNAQLPASLAEHYGVEVVPLTVAVDGVDHLEGVDLDADRFYDLLQRDPPPTVATAAPAPGRFLAAYERLAAAGATEILSIHIGSAISGTCNAASVAARGAPVPVRVVDTGTASFGIACAVWAAGERLARGGSADEAATAAVTVAGRCGNVFVVGALDAARAGGRLAAGTEAAEAVLTVLALVDGAMRPVAEARDAGEAVRVLDEHVSLRADDPDAVLRVGVGHSDASSLAIADALADRLAARGAGVDVVRYRVGPSVGAHTGPGTAGAVFTTFSP